VLRKIECFVQPSKLEALTAALVGMNVDGMSVTEIRGFGRQRGHVPADGEGGAPKFLPKLKIEIVVTEEMVEEAVRVIVQLARTGTVGAGKVFVVPVEDAIRVGSGQKGYPAVK